MDDARPIISIPPGITAEAAERRLETTARNLTKRIADPRGKLDASLDLTFHTKADGRIRAQVCFGWLVRSAVGADRSVALAKLVRTLHRMLDRQQTDDFVALEQAEKEMTWLGIDTEGDVDGEG